MRSNLREGELLSNMKRRENMSDEGRVTNKGQTTDKNLDEKPINKRTLRAPSFFFSSATQKVERIKAQKNERKSFMVSFDPDSSDIQTPL